VGRIARGWELSKKSFALVEHDRRLLLFPAISILATVAAAVIIFAPAYAWWQASGGDGPWVVGGLLGVYALNVISLFFGVAFIAVARKSLAGEAWTMWDGWLTATSRLGPILLWALVATAVGLLLRALERVRGGFLVNIVARWVLGAAWSLATFFVVPVLALEGGSPFKAAGRSVQVVRKRWGEGVVGATAIEGLFVIVVMAGVVPLVLGLATVASAPVVGVPLIAVAVFIIALGMVVNSAVSQLFRFVLYEYAVSDRAIGPFGADELDQAFRPRRRFLHG
jgi:Family of unknown function (DUF6159)